MAAKMFRARVLVADDDDESARLISAILRPEGCEILRTSESTGMVESVDTEPVDVVIMGDTIRKADGLALLQLLRQRSEVPVIVVGDRQDSAYKLKCLTLGADYYITKPFGAEGFVARFRSLLRRTGTVHSMPARPSFVSGDLCVDFAKHRVTVAGHEIALTPTEYCLLQELVLNEGRVLTYRHLLKRIWGGEYETEREYIHTFVRHLRSKIEADPGNPRYIITVARVGYLFKSNG